MAEGEEMGPIGRLFLCARCRAQVVLCSRCDRGNIYCGTACARARRHESIRAAGKRYQGSRAGRFAHAARARRYRARRQNVTHQGSAPTPLAALLMPAAVLLPPASNTGRDAVVATVVALIGTSTPRCSRCGALRAIAVRQGWLRQHRRASGHLTGSKRSASADDFP